MLTKVYIPGVWDLLHVGHVTILESAKRLGGLLIVGVPTDEVVVLDKGKPPIIKDIDRAKMLQALRCTDLVAIYDRLEFITHLELFKPQIFVCGETWGSDQRHIMAEQWCMKNQCSMIQLPYYKNESTTKIKGRIHENSLAST